MNYRATLTGGFHEGARLTVFQPDGNGSYIQLQAGDGIEVIEGPEEGSIISVNYVDSHSLELLVGRTLRRLRPADGVEVPESRRVSGQRVQNWIVMPS
ncbi:MAG: hypothetical protein IR164_03815 [Devosia sp.]|uniref:hypothetical protein n=1 Tax=Devosia sp. TaxID=1871048 RepID=UPI0019E5A48B|nr:hypothetical protein [Devosia sp.]MBF0678051.1 hypothetical protein [Devosia sp.]